MNEPTEEPANRRPLTSRSTGWARAITRTLLTTPISPNAISMFGVAFAAVGAAAFLLAAHSPWWWLVGALCIQLRLLANLFDGLVAIEGGRQSPTGGLFNEFPDRIEDSLLLIAAGYGAGYPTLGWCAALFAVGAAYVRALGGTLGLDQDFCGPMAKQHRMAALTAATTGGALIALIATPIAALDKTIVAGALALIAVGAAATCLRRLYRQAAALKARADIPQ